MTNKTKQSSKPPSADRLRVVPKWALRAGEGVQALFAYGNDHSPSAISIIIAAEAPDVEELVEAANGMLRWPRSRLPENYEQREQYDAAYQRLETALSRWRGK